MNIYPCEKVKLCKSFGQLKFWQKNSKNALPKRPRQFLQFSHILKKMKKLVLPWTNKLHK